MIVLVDNHDSFTYNIYQYFRKAGAAIRVVRNDEMSASAVMKLAPSAIVLSPGPGQPERSGISFAVLHEAVQRVMPVLGICLGHEIIYSYFGGRIGPAAEIMHAKQSRIAHDQTRLFAGLPHPLTVGRYHSLAADASTLPAVLKITARTVDGVEEIMAIEHCDLPIFGVQFHPESILSEAGQALIGNFLHIMAEPVR